MTTMAKLGSFGAAVREFDPDGERDTFEFFEQTFEVRGVIPPMLMLQLGAAIAGKISEMDGNAAVYEALRCALSTPAGEDGEPEDDSQFNQFHKLAVRRRCDTDTLLRLVFEIVGAQGGKATEPPPTSQPGPPPASTSSNSSASDSPDSHRMVSVDEVLAG